MFYGVDAFISDRNIAHICATSTKRGQKVNRKRLSKNRLEHFYSANLINFIQNVFIPVLSTFNNVEFCLKTKQNKKLQD